jgi:Uma2 family endonuclease
MYILYIPYETAEGLAVLPHAAVGASRAVILGAMSTLVLDPAPPELEALKEKRRRLGQDLYDEVWEGVYRMVPAPHSRHGKVDDLLAAALREPAAAAGLVASGPVNVGEAEDFRVPDRALLRPGADGVWLPTAALVVEIVSPDDESWQKLPFYAAHGVDEVLIVDPQERSVYWLGLAEGEYREVERSGLIELGPGELAERIEWP